MFCKNCGAEIGDDKKFCPQCGASTDPNAVEIETENVKNNNKGVLPKIGIVYKLIIIVFEIVILSQSLVSCGTKGYECFVSTFKPTDSIMITKSNLFSGYTSGCPGVYVVSFVVITYVILLLLSLIFKDKFWKKFLHTNIFCTASMIITAVLYKKFGDSNFQPTIMAYVCIGISLIATIVYSILFILMPKDDKKYPFIKKFVLLFILFIIFMYVFGAIIPLVTGNVS